MIGLKRNNMEQLDVSKKLEMLKKLKKSMKKLSLSKLGKKSAKKSSKPAIDGPSEPASTIEPTYPGFKQPF